jgi:hypothetical protein
METDSKSDLKRFVSCTVAEAAEAAKKFCKENPEWVRICDLEHGSECFYESFSDLPRPAQMSWIGTYGSRAEEAYNEFATKKCKVPEGFIDGAGNFYGSVYDIPRLVNTMMVFMRN